ncbi:transcription factor TGA2-like isoform X1 [Populus alba x Populus x berolinensis]|uniref:Transcription factor TGA2-like n=3 Tax=Populus TaxID=3689 RepID=A0A4U5QGH1_POPAL|nr:transcription factor TGA2-like isoform X1 [Populus alba]XP_034921184.1 transcription factor TGA2-like isoform X1 [Populus alba]XP_034921185.1 transcription factor TGA2-like isoform X1 [Populus alba]XP_034921186.1 transcription factor TGA2-like isoform X1 [Populus alba]XP_034921187.1 transcription factor TGA2-like isoform X1 [Populus alba]XP_034921188.1 transcription factor TGA2-like isoform X1 [Populus alba]XP_034921189.1 transcription factor TGA2-like isoform X1 [Populus alba]KAJ6961503.
MGSRTGAEDEKKAVVMPSFDPQLPISNAICVEGSTIHPHCATYFGVFLEDDAIDLSPGAVFNSAKERTQAIPSDPLNSGAFDKKQSSSVQVESQRLPLEKVQRLNRVSIPSVSTENWGETQKLLLENIQQSNQVSIPSVNTENWGETNMADASPRTDISTDADTDDKNQRFDGSQSLALVASDSSDRSKDKMDHKTLRRLAQNREAARKSRLRKKAYVQQLESSRLKLTQLEQELQRARQQGIFVSSSGDQSHSMSGNGAMAFDVEYARWLEDQNRQINELRSAVNSHTGDTELRIIIDGIMAHYDEVFRLKSNAAKADVFHLLSGMWKTPAERCFLWLGGFRSSELLKLLVNQLEPLTDQQLVGIGNLQQSSQQAEDALSQGMEALQQSLAETLSSGPLGSSGSSGNVANYMGQMAMAMGKLGTLEGFIRQADNLRQQTLQQMHRILTTRQSARALLAIHDYFSRLRALSSLWLARPRE